MAKSYIYYTHRNVEIRTISDFLDTELNPTCICRGMKIAKFLAFKDPVSEGGVGITNLERIYKTYSHGEQFLNSQKYQADLLILSQAEFPEDYTPQLTLLKFNTTFVVPNTSLFRDILTGEGTQVVNYTTYDMFLADALEELLLDPKYTQSIKMPRGGGIVNSLYPHVSVWLWNRAGSLLREDSTQQNVPIDYSQSLHGKIIDITPFVKRINTRVDSNGGSWSIDLPHLTAMWTTDSGWQINGQHIQIMTSEFVAKGSFYKIEDDELIHTDSYFSRAVGENDVIFIRFESLQMENREAEPFDSNFEISKQQLPGKIYDMIGLVDVNHESRTSDNSVDISIRGRDLRKLFNEDGCYFYPLQYTEGGLFSNDTNPRALERHDGKLAGITQVDIKSIAYSLKFIFNALSNISIVPDDTFNAYGDKRTRRFNIDTQATATANEHRDQQNNEKKTQLAKLREDAIEAVKKCREKYGVGLETDIIAFNVLKDFLLQLDIDGGFIMAEDGQTPYWPKGFVYYSDIIPEDKKNNKGIIPNYIFNNLLFIAKGVLVDKNGHYVSKTRLDALNGQIKTQLRPVIEDVGGNLNALTGDKSLSPFKDLAGGGFEILIPGVGIPLIAGQMVMNSLNVKEEPDTNPLKNLDTDEYYEVIDLANTYRIGSRDATVVPEIDFKPFIGINGELVVDPQQERINRRTALDKLAEESNGIHYITLNTSFSNAEPELIEAIKKTWQYVIFDKTLIPEQPAVFQEELCKGIWQIHKLVIDQSISERRIVDASIGNNNGSLMGEINKVCQNPFVEFYTDTYGDQFYSIVRQPPFTYKSYKKLADLAITLDDADIYSTNIQYENENIYSWYWLKVLAYGGSGDKMASAYLKAVHFSEYMDIWGDRPLEITSNYIPFKAISGNVETQNVASVIRQSIYDLKFLIDTNAYMPFTRKGSIVMNGDRRIKKGTCVRLKSTGEIFYVDSIDQMCSINDKMVDRATTINISRGMREKHLKKYFAIIDTSIDEDFFLRENERNNPVDWATHVQSNWKVNSNVFNFFLRRQQWSRSNGNSEFELELRNVQT